MSAPFQKNLFFKTTGADSANYVEPPIADVGPAASADNTDEQLLHRHGRGDRTAFKILVHRYESELYNYLARFLGDRDAAADIFQDAFLQVHQSLGGFDVDRKFRPWLFTIAANKARDLLRLQTRRPIDALQAGITIGEEGGRYTNLIRSDQELPDQTMQRQELQQRVRLIVMGMPSQMREILLLAYFHQFPYRQIGEILGIPVGTVKSRLHSAITFFADRWKSVNRNVADSY